MVQRGHMSTIINTELDEERAGTMGLILLIVVLLLLFGGGWGYRSGGTAYFQSPLGIILIVVLLVVLFGGFVGPRLGYYHY